MCAICVRSSQNKKLDRNHSHKFTQIHESAFESAKKRKNTIAKIKSKHKNTKKKKHKHTQNSVEQRVNTFLKLIYAWEINKYSILCVYSMYKYVQQITNMRSQMSLKRGGGEQNVTAQVKERKKKTSLTNKNIKRKSTKQ